MDTVGFSKSRQVEFVRESITRCYEVIQYRRYHFNAPDDDIIIRHQLSRVETLKQLIIVIEKLTIDYDNILP